MSMYLLLFLLSINFNEYQTILLRGKRAYEGQFPWLLQFQTISPCGGILLSSDWVLTAALCVQDKRNSISLFAAGLNGTGSKQWVSVKATYIYPDYDAYSILPDRDHNIALLKLIEPFDICDSRITLPNVKAVDYDNDYTSCFIFGWQSYLSPSSRVFAKPIQYNEVSLNSWKLCTYTIKVNTNYTNHTNVFCTMVEFKDGMKACAGNPGSPVVCENQYREIAVLGIASWSNFSLECGDLPTYLDLSIFRVWIYDLLVDNKTEKLQNNSGKSDNFESNKSIISWKGKTRAETNYIPNNTKIYLQNLSVVASVYQEISTESINMTQFWNKLYSPLNIQRDTSASVSHNYRYYHHRANYTNILKESSNNIYKYEEIDKEKSFQDQITESTKKDERSNLNKSILCGKRFNTITVEPNNHSTEFNSFEFLVPFTIENVVTSCSNIATTSKNIYFLIYILVYFWFYLDEIHYTLYIYYILHEIHEAV